MFHLVDVKIELGKFPQHSDVHSVHFNLIKVFFVSSSFFLFQVIVWIIMISQSLLYLLLISCHKREKWKRQEIEWIKAKWWRKKWGKASVLETHFKFTKTFTIFAFYLSPLTFMLSLSIIDAQWSHINEWKLWWDFCDYKQQQCYLRYWKLYGCTAGMRKIIIILSWVRELKAKEHRVRGDKLFQTARVNKNAGRKINKTIFIFYIVLILLWHQAHTSFCCTLSKFTNWIRIWIYFCNIFLCVSCALDKQFNWWYFISEFFAWSSNIFISFVL